MVGKCVVFGISPWAAHFGFPSSLAGIAGRSDLDGMLRVYLIALQWQPPVSSSRSSLNQLIAGVGLLSLQANATF